MKKEKTLRSAMKPVTRKEFDRVCGLLDFLQTANCALVEIMEERGIIADRQSFGQKMSEIRNKQHESLQAERQRIVDGLKDAPPDVQEAARRAIKRFDEISYDRRAT